MYCSCARAAFFSLKKNGYPAMEGDMLTVFILITLIFIFVLIIMAYRAFSQGSEKKPRAQVQAEHSTIPCIICGSVLKKGERLRSTVYTGEDESIVHVFGCPHCYGDYATRERRCPVCKRLLSEEAYLIGRMWKRRSGKQHLRIAGCTRCISPRK
jgi:hypothetical protein